MPETKIIKGQHVTAGQSERARDMRRNMTPAESRLWQRLRAGRLGGYHFRRQKVIDQFIVDFYCHRAGLVVEVDGSVHQKQKEYDRERDFYLCSRGLRVMRFTNTDVNDQIETVLVAVLEACADARKEEIGDA